MDQNSTQRQKHRKHANIALGLVFSLAGISGNAEVGGQFNGQLVRPQAFGLLQRLPELSDFVCSVDAYKTENGAFKPTRYSINSVSEAPVDVSRANKNDDLFFVHRNATNGDGLIISARFDENPRARKMIALTVKTISHYYDAGSDTAYLDIAGDWDASSFGVKINDTNIASHIMFGCKRKI